MSDLQQIAIILNPIAGRGRAKKAEKDLIAALRKRKKSFYIVHTKYPAHAIHLAKYLSNKFSTIVAAGGDGTVSETARGMIGSKSSLAFLPIGSGNDFNKISLTPKSMFEAIDTIGSKRMRSIDIGKITVRNISGELRHYNFINTLGIGIDAQIAKEVKQIKHIRGLKLYLLAAIKSLVNYIPNYFTIDFNKRTFKEESFLLCVGNGKFEGGGFNMVPKALPDDRMLDICIIKKMPISEALTVIPMIIKGTHEKHKNVIMERTKKIELSSEKPFIIHADGEILEEKAVQINIELEREKLSVITG
jgi:diacylglycerol kinase (ATP)